MIVVEDIALRLNSEGAAGAETLLPLLELPPVLHPPKTKKDER